MSILREIHSWSQGLPAWQQDAIARLYTNKKLEGSDWEDLYALSKSDAGIEDPMGRKPKELLEAQVASPLVPTRLVQLTAIKELSNLNALVDGGKLPIEPIGLTVIYGENGAGKSGYSRALKHACRARDQREPILPNAKLDPGKAGPIKAVFEAVIDGLSVDLPWAYKGVAPEPLSEIAIFDTHCARAYIDNQGDFAYAPYGLDILEGLVAVCNKLKDTAIREKASNTPNDAAYAALAKEQTAVGRALAGIPKVTKAGEIEALAMMSEPELERLDFLNKTLAEADPKQKAQAMRQNAARFSGLSARIESASTAVGDAKLAELKALVEASNAAKKAAELAAADFKETPGQLPGTGADEWKVLFEAARSFAAISHKAHTFPSLPEESVCPLCQKTLGAEGSQRLARFDAFIQRAAETTAKEARSQAAIAYRAIEQARLDLAIDEALSQDLADISAGLAAACSAMHVGLVKRQAAAMEAAAGKIGWDAVDAMPSDPRAALAETVGKLLEQSKALDAAMDEKAKAMMVAERAGLEARRRLGEVKAVVLETIAKHEHCAKLQKCIDGMGTTGISRKSTDLSRTVASQELADALNKELKRLKVHELQVIMKSESPGGRTRFKLALQLPGGGAPAAILSEGEQRAIAIASFLAEINLGKGRGGVVFDDPVSSLDHRRRWEVAERLAAEAKDRQVIVFTHDIYFLCILEQKAEELGTPIAKQYIRKTSEGFGVHSQDLPFDVLGTKERIGRLRNMLVEVRKAQKSGDEDMHRRLTREVYGHLRLAWERSVEEVLFNGSIQRFGEGIQTQRLREVSVTDDDYKQIYASMTKSSKFEHDAAAAVSRLPVPEPDELERDVESLDAWRKAVINRRKIVASAR